MKVYLSVDIEGVAGIAAAAEANMAMPAEYQPFRRQMAAEATAACRGAVAAGATTLLVKDAHGTGRNLLPGDFDAVEGCDLRLIRGWSGHPLAMVQDIDASFDALLFVGFHCAAGQAGNPLAHTINGALFAKVELNGAVASELRLYALAAAEAGVPLVFVSGDRTVCDEAEALAPGVATLSTLEGRGPSATSIAPATATRLIEERVRSALQAERPPLPPLPDRFSLRVEFRHAADAYARSFYPGVRQTGERVLELESETYLPILTFLRFASRYQ